MVGGDEMVGGEVAPSTGGGHSQWASPPPRSIPSPWAWVGSALLPGKSIRNAKAPLC